MSSSSQDVTSSDVFLLFDDTREFEKFDVAKNIIDTHVRQNVENDTFNYSIQPELKYDLDKEQLVNDFSKCIDAVELLSEEQEFGTVRINIIASTIETARLTEAPNEPSYDTPQSFKNTTWVKCSLNVSCRFSVKGVHTNVAISVVQHPIDRPNQQ